MIGSSTTGNISFGIALVTGRNRVPIRRIAQIAQQRILQMSEAQFE